MPPRTRRRKRRFQRDEVDRCCPPGHRSAGGRVKTVAYEFGELWGGVGLNSDRASLQKYIQSDQRFAGIVKEAGADIILANHTDWDHTKVNLPILAKRTPGTPNPYIVGNAKAVNFLKVAEECATARIPTVN